MKAPDGIFPDPLYARSRKVYAADDGAPQSRVVWLEDAQADRDRANSVMADALNRILNVRDVERQQAAARLKAVEERLAAAEKELEDAQAKAKHRAVELEAEKAHAEKWHQVAVTGGKRMEKLLKALEEISTGWPVAPAARAQEALDVHQASIQAAPLGPLPDMPSAPLVPGALEDGWPSEAEPDTISSERFVGATPVPEQSLPQEYATLEELVDVALLSLDDLERESQRAHRLSEENAEAIAAAGAHLRARFGKS